MPPNGKFRTWLHIATLVTVIIVAILHFQTTWRIEALGQGSYTKVSEAVEILRQSQSDVHQAGENSNKLVTNSELAIQKIETLEKRLNRLEQELRNSLTAIVEEIDGTISDLETHADRLDHKLAAIAELKEHVRYFRWIAEHPTEYLRTSWIGQQEEEQDE